MLNFSPHCFGHQLYGLYTCIILKDIRNSNFYPYSFIKKKFKI